ncbi:hypothetical protein [Cupriavidus lacunae]|uniref:Uncharacterized protein n=1 Tax=Cupriavidus lacunae TaxID=2666307 RepID=A0A370NMS5_9BURK|nr:hypothetical protein [Cupriavidus lacunae]RDK06843.1 hypothetical protein DN412_29130 [Cupriavidus lacunae]
MKPSDKSAELLRQIESFLNGLTDEEKKEITELQFTAVKQIKNTTLPTVCFSLVASVPFAKGGKGKVKKP